MKTRLDYLDSIRAIAILLVIIQHVILHLKRNNLLEEGSITRISSFLTDFLDLGKIGVGLFFILSGFVISFSLKRGTSVQSFFIKRFFRLYPLFWISIFLGIIILWQEVPSTNTIVANVTMLPNFFGQPAIIGVYWTLQIELIFYIIAAILFKLNYLHATKKVFYISVFFLIVALFFSFMRFYLEKKIPVALPLALSIMFFGSMFMNFVVTNNSSSKNYSYKYSIIFILVMPLISYLAYNIDFGFHEKWYRYLLSYYIAFFSFILLVTKIKIYNQVLVYLGVISYSTYLMHPLVIAILSTLKLDLFLNNILFLLLTISISIIVSIVSFKLLEQNFIQLSRNFLLWRKK